MTLIALTALGLVLGSFFSVLITRLHTGEPGIIYGRSRCTTCKNPLKALHLMPVVSFILQKGSCAFCRTRISFWYPALELSTALVFLGVAWLGTSSSIPQLAMHLSLASIWILIFFYDLKYKAIHDGIVLSGILISLINVAIWGEPLASLYGALFALVFFGGQWVLSHGRWIGSGDIGIGVFMGIHLGWPLLYMGILSGYVSGSLISISLLLLEKATRESQIPLGPFLALGTMLAYLLPFEVLL